MFLFGHLSRLPTKGTTILMFAQQDNFFISVDSRETLTTTTDKFMLNEHLKFSRNTNCLVILHLRLFGQGVLEHMVENTEDLFY